MYSLHFYGEMIVDTPRMDAYAAALRQTVKPDSIVMDLGCGPGLLALLACKLGARRVYAVEPHNVIGLAREVAAANGFADRIKFFESLSTEITLDERADIIVSDLRGVLPWFQQHIPSIKDARTRLLAREGKLIPQGDLVWAAVVEAEDRYNELVSPWENNSFGLDLTAGTRLITNTWRKTRIRPEQLLVEPVRWGTIDYYKVDSADIEAEISWRVARNGTAHGIAAWFDTELIDGIGFSNHPGGPELIYGNGLFPFLRPVEVLEGERITVRLAAKMVEGDYVWRWDTDFYGVSGDSFGVNDGSYEVNHTTEVNDSSSEVNASSSLVGDSSTGVNDLYELNPDSHGTNAGAVGRNDSSYQANEDSSEVNHEYRVVNNEAHPRISFKQSTFYGVPLSRALLQKARANPG